LPCADRERACKRVLETPASKRPSRPHALAFAVPLPARRGGVARSAGVRCCCAAPVSRPYPFIFFAAYCTDSTIVL
jgi:hypothetical protein